MASTQLRKPTRTVRFSVDLDIAVHRWLTAEARRRGVPKTRLVRDLIGELMAHDHETRMPDPDRDSDTPSNAGHPRSRRGARLDPTQWNGTQVQDGPTAFAAPTHVEFPPAYDEVDRQSWLTMADASAEDDA